MILFKRISAISFSLLIALSLTSCNKGESLVGSTTLVDNTNFNKKIVQDALNASVSLYITTKDRSSFGSGVIYRILNEDGSLCEKKEDFKSDNLSLFIVTNAHVVKDYYNSMQSGEKSSLDVIFTANDNSDRFSPSGSYTTKAELMGLDPVTDLAAVKTTVNYKHLESHTNRSVHSVNLFPKTGSYDRTKPNVGSDSFAIGSPASLHYVLSYSEGKITRVNSGTIASEAAIGFGNSGGGLFELYTGRLIGINSQGRLESNNGIFIEANNYSINIDLILNSIGEITKEWDQLKEKKVIVKKRLNAFATARVVTSDNTSITYKTNPSNVAGLTGVYKNVLVYNEYNVLLSSDESTVQIDGFNTTHPTSTGNISKLKVGDIFTSIVCPYDISELGLHKGDTLALDNNFDLSFYLSLFDLDKIDSLKINGFYSVLGISPIGPKEIVVDYVETTFTVKLN